MKKAFILMILMTGGLLTKAQIYNPVKWNYAAVKVADKTYEIHVTASIENQWRMYAQEAGKNPAATSFRFIKNPVLSFDGNVKEIGKLEKYYDRNLRSMASYYGNKVLFIQKVKLRSPVTTSVKGAVNYVACNERKCLPPKDVSFSVNVGGM